MNYQKEPPKYVLDILKEREVQFMEISYYAYPQVFDSTAGPCRGIGGDSMTSFTVEAYVCDLQGPVVYICSGMFIFTDNKFEPFKVVNEHWLPIKKISKKKVNKPPAPPRPPANRQIKEGYKPKSLRR